MRTTTYDIESIMKTEEHDSRCAVEIPGGQKSFRRYTPGSKIKAGHYPEAYSPYR